MDVQQQQYYYQGGGESKTMMMEQPQQQYYYQGGWGTNQHQQFLLGIPPVCEECAGNRVAIDWIWI